MNIGRSLELLAIQATAPGAGGAIGAAVTGDSLTMKFGKKSRILTMWADLQVAGSFRLTNASGHDLSTGLRLAVPASDLDLKFPSTLDYDVPPQEAIAVTIFGSGTAGDIETVMGLVEYDGLFAQKLISESEVKRRKVQLITVHQALTAGAAGGYSGERSFILDNPNMRANTDYAVVGYVCSAETAAVYFRGPDTGDRKIGGPGNDLDHDLTRDWFLMLSRLTGEDCIPVINTGNLPSTFGGVVGDENSTATVVSWILAQLK